MELRHLKYFVMVAQELNFSNAAIKLHTVQPSLSQQIRDLEDFIGVQLFIRTKRKVELTHEGSIFLQHAKLILQSAEKAVSITRQSKKNSENHLKIGFVPVAEIKILPLLIPILNKLFPHLTTELISLNDTQMLSAIDNGHIDIALSRADMNNEEIYSQKIFEEPLIFLMNKDHALAKLNEIPIKLLEDHKFIIPSKACSPQLHHKIIDFMQSQNVDLNIIQEADNILFNINFLNINKTCTILPSYVTEILNENIISKPLDIKLPHIELFLSKRKSNDSQKFIDFFKTIDNFQL